MILKYSYKIIYYYFFLNLLDAIFKIVKIDLQIDKLLDFAILFIIISTKNIRLNTLDYLVLAYLVYCLFTIFINVYPHQLIISYYAIKGSWLIAFLFFIGRNIEFSDKIIYKKMIIPIAFSLVCGLYFHFTQPSWYVFMKSTLLDLYANDFMVNEAFRMSSFWSYPQFLAYSNFIFLTYLFYEKYVLGKMNNYIFMALIFLSIFSMALIQIRITIIFSFFAIFTFVFWDFKFNNAKNRGISFIGISILFAAIVTLILFISVLKNDSFIEKIYSITNFLDTSKERVNDQLQNEGVFKYFSYDLWGHGMGRFAISVSQFNMPDMRDGGFLIEIMEKGFFGFSILLLIIFMTIFRLVSFFKFLVFEFVIFIFFIFASIGANVISEFWLLNSIFWVNLGVIWSNQKLNSKIKFLNFKKLNSISTIHS